MKKKIDYRVIAIIILIVMLIAFVYIYLKEDTTASYNADSSTSESSTTTISEDKAQILTILNTISSTGEISSSLEENLELHATYYFSEIYFEENDYVEEGTAILKYTNGTYLKAPYNLVITKINVPDSAGSQCTNKHYITVKGTDMLTMSLKIDEDDLSEISVGQEAQIEVAVYSDKVYTGYVTKISSTASYSSSGSKFTVTVEFQNDGQILIGMTGSSSVILEKAENVVAVPLEAVQTKNNQKYVVVVDESGNTKNVTVDTGISNDAYTQIKSGLSGNERVQVVKQESSGSSFSSFGGMGGMQIEGQGMPTDFQGGSGMPTDFRPGM